MKWIWYSVATLCGRLFQKSFWFTVFSERFSEMPQSLCNRTELGGCGHIFVIRCSWVGRGHWMETWQNTWSEGRRLVRRECRQENTGWKNIKSACRENDTGLPRLERKGGRSRCCVGAQPRLQPGWEEKPLAFGILELGYICPWEGWLTEKKSLTCVPERADVDLRQIFAMYACFRTNMEEEAPCCLDTRVTGNACSLWTWDLERLLGWGVQGPGSPWGLLVPYPLVNKLCFC